MRELGRVAPVEPVTEDTPRIDSCGIFHIGPVDGPPPEGFQECTNKGTEKCTTKGTKKETKTEWRLPRMRAKFYKGFLVLK